MIEPGRLADEYVRSAGRKVEEVMAPEPWTVSEADTLATVVELMERRCVKRLPVLRDGRLVGIISRANLVDALSELIRYKDNSPADDATIRERILVALANIRRTSTWRSTTPSSNCRVPSTTFASARLLSLQPKTSAG